MSSLLKTASKGKGKAKNGSLPSTDLKSAAEDMALEAGVDLDEEDADVDMDGGDEEVERPAKKQKIKAGKEKASKNGAGADGEAEGEKKRKDKVLLLSSRGTTQRMRHLMLDLETILPHVKKDAKLDSKSSLHLINEVADLHSCNNVLYFEARRHEDLYLWISRAPNGPSMKCHVQNVHTMDELKMTGNCLKGSRGLVVFDGGWDGDEQWKMMKELLTHTFSVPRTSRRLKPFIDHILTFSLLDNKIWFRNYQIVEKDPLKPSGPPQTSLVEIGPRFVLTPIRIFEGSLGGPTVFANPEFITPAAARATVKRAQAAKHKGRQYDQEERKDRVAKRKAELSEDELEVAKVFS